jgi:hypothetical protein
MEKTMLKNLFFLFTLISLMSFNAFAHDSHTNEGDSDENIITYEELSPQILTCHDGNDNDNHGHDENNGQEGNILANHNCNNKAEENDNVDPIACDSCGGKDPEIEEGTFVCNCKKQREKNRDDLLIIADSDPTDGDGEDLEAKWQYSKIA